MILKPVGLLATTPSSSPVEYISSASSHSSATLSLPTHAAGDLILMFAVRGGSTRPTIPDGWNNLNLVDTANFRVAGAYKIAASNAETSGTWTNTEANAAIVFRNADPPGTIEWQGGGDDYAGCVYSICYPAWTASASGSLLLAVGCHRGANVATWSDPYSEDVETKTSVQQTSNGEAVALHVSPDTISSSDGGSVTARSNTGTTNDSAGYMIEIKQA